MYLKLAVLRLLSHLFPGVICGIVLVLSAPPSGGRAAGHKSSIAPCGISHPVQVKIGERIERELRAEESHSYDISLSADDYLYLRVVQKGADLTVKLHSPQNEILASGDRPNLMYGPKPLHFVTPSSGLYRLEIRSASAKAEPGKYTVEIVALRPATSRDRRLVEAQSVFSQAWQRQQEKDWKLAIEKYLETLAIYREIGDESGQALAMTQLGLSNSRQGKPGQAADWYQQAIVLWRKADDIYGEARTVNNLGVVYNFQGELQSAWDCYQRALPLWRAIGDRNGEARTLMNIGVAHSFVGERDEALRHYLRALELWRTAEDRKAEAWPLNNIGLIYAGAGDYEQALAYYNQALKLARDFEQDDEIASTLNDIGEVYAMQRDEKPALQRFDEALSIRRRIGQKREEAMTLLNIAFVHAFSERHEAAMTFYRQALSLARSTNHRWVEAGALNQMGDLLVAERPDEARENFLGAIDIYRHLRDYEAEAGTLFRLARLEHSQNNLSQSRARIESAIKLIENLRTKVSSHDLRVTIFAARQDFFEFYVDLLMQMRRQNPGAGLDQIAWQAAERSRARSLLEMLGEARADIRRGVSPELLAQERQLRVRLAGKANRHLEILSAEEKPRPEIVAASESDIRQIQTELEQTLAQIRAASPRYAELTQLQPITLTEAQQQLDHQTILLQYMLGKERSHLWVISKDSLESYPLPPRAEIEGLARQAYELLTTRLPREGETERERIARLVRARSADQLYWKVAAQLSRILLGDVADRIRGKRLVIVPDGPLHYVSFAALPAPQGTEAIINENGAAPDPAPLVVDHEIVDLPSASILQSLRQSRPDRPAAQKEIAVFADPVFSITDRRLGMEKARAVYPNRAQPAKRRIRHSAAGLEENAKTRSDNSGGSVSSPPTTLPTTSLTRGDLTLRRLPFSLREAEAIAALAAPGSALIAQGFQANRDAVVNSPLNQYRRLHFATHALLNEKQPALSGVVLSRFKDDGSPQPGFLGLQDIYNLNLAADQVVLSACQTAMGKEMKGEGVIGLTRGFLHSGATRVVSSFWKVDDIATSELMELYYQGVLKQGMSPAAALRRAQIMMWKQARRRPPYFWAAFALHGDWK